ncbi:virulence RhuM family protein [Patescibacteria group bacterium]|nr:virulence RhuM family protein [Patescibacteria group bacterium]
MKKLNRNSQIIIYKTEDGQTKIDVRFEGDTVWLTQNALAELFQTTKNNISQHVKNIFEEGEIDKSATVKKFLTVQKEGARKVSRSIEYYNLDLIISVGYRVKSSIATSFRQWATLRLREYIVKGFTLDDERLKGSGGGNYWKELLDRIRDIRSSEKALYRQVLDLYATSIDYDPDSRESIEFFKVVQNKLHYAINRQTAAETIYERVDAKKDFMGLTTFVGVMPVLSEVVIAKNYLSKEELFRLNRMVSAFFDLAEIRAKEHTTMRMVDWVKELNKFTKNFGKGTLVGAGKVSHREAVKKAKREYRKYQAKILSPVERAYLQSIKAVEQRLGRKINGNKKRSTQ